MDKLDQFIKSSSFLDEQDKEDINRLLEAIIELPSEDVNLAMTKWSLLATRLSWFVASAGKMVENKTQEKDARINTLYMNARNNGGKDPQWVTTAQAQVDPEYVRLCDEVTTLRAWHDFMIKTYNIVMGQQRLLEQLSNNVRANVHLDNQSN